MRFSAPSRRTQVNLSPGQAAQTAFHLLCIDPVTTHSLQQTPPATVAAPGIVGIMAAPRPEVGDILLVIHDFIARSSDELSLAKGDRVELIERDDEFGDGWFLGKHLVNGNSGLFPEGELQQPAPKTAPTNNFSKPLATLPEVTNEPKQTPAEVPTESKAATPTPPPAPVSPADSTAPVTLPLNSIKQETSPSDSAPPVAGSLSSSLGRLNTNQDHVLNETLNVIDEHITDLRSAPSNGALRAPTDSGSEYSANLDHRMSYIHGEETDEEEEGMHSRSEVEAWSADDVAEYLFTVGVEKSHCEVFRDQEITGEVLLGMDQSSLFIKAFELGSVGRRLKTWQKIKSLQDECNNIGVATRRTTQTYGSDVGSEDAKRSRSRTNTLTNSIPRMTPVDDRAMSLSSKRLSFSQTPKLDTATLVSPVSPITDSPTRPSHMKRPSAASVRDLHHSRRHSSSTDFRLTGTTMGNAVTPKLATSGTFPQADGVHKKQPSFDRNWTLGGASQRPLSSTGFQDVMQQSGLHAPESAIDTDRGYFSGTEVDGRRRNVLKKRDSTASHSRKHSYADEQRVRSATAISRHSRFGSVDSTRDSVASPAAQKYYGMQSTTPHRRTASTSTTQSARPAPPIKDTGAPSVTKLDGATSTIRESPVPQSPAARQGYHAEWLSAVVKPSVKVTGLRAISDSVSSDRKKMASPVDSPLKVDSPLHSPARTGSSTPSAGPSFELDSPDTAKSPSTATTVASKGSRKKGKKETSAYQRGLLKISPAEAMKDADYSGWMRKKSSNLMTTWKPRFFVLKGRRLAYYYSESDDQEKGLIDISFHRVLPADNERLTGLHATLTGAGAAAREDASGDKGDDAMFIFKLVPPRAGLSRAVNFTKPTVHYFAVPNLKQGRLWMAALMKATIDRDDTQAITTTYQQKTISLAKAQQQRHRPPALMNLNEATEEERKRLQEAKKNPDVLGITFGETDSGVSGLEKPTFKVEPASARKLAFESENNGTGEAPPQSA
ncbi:SAM domain-containing protein [Colletotrichum karsti]|uniref:SAM domain-containing protein n=1 Tax=Colletotrichum karsti TaxID=1095194 RepID=A0A9P6LRC3_9PEZI|nr:SAM domain-containing protein [Colletotrichum karsti]KAF9882392.1 SAM domain-containing protein [Colletotrichum karsti]